MAVIAQLSDFHLGDDPVAEGRLAAVLAHLAAMATPVDAIVVTGDVLDDPAHGDYAAIGRRLAALGRPLVGCPGNHDDRAAFRALWGGEPADRPVTDRLEVAGVTILACDTSVPGEPWGLLAEETLEWLDRELATAAGPVVLALHHPPVALGLPLVDVIALREPGRLERILHRHEGTVIGLLAGHAHTAASTTFAGVPLFVSPAVSSTLMLRAETGVDRHFDRTAPPGLALHVVEGGRVTSHVRVVAAMLPEWARGEAVG